MGNRLIYSVAPKLPRGLTIDILTGRIHGIGEEATEGPVTHFVAACEPSVYVSQIKIAMVDITIVAPQAPSALLPNTHPNLHCALGAGSPCTDGQGEQEVLAWGLQEQLAQASAALLHLRSHCSGSDSDPHQYPRQ